MRDAWFEVNTLGAACRYRAVHDTAACALTAPASLLGSYRKLLSAHRRSETPCLAAIALSCDDG